MEFSPQQHHNEYEVSQRANTLSNPSNGSMGMAAKATTGLHHLPTELLIIIINDHALTLEDKFCAKVSTCHFYYIGPSFDELKAKFTAQQRYELAVRLSRRAYDSYLCSGCRTRHPSHLFEDEEKWKDDLHRRCVGRTGAMVLFKGVYITWDCIEKARQTTSVLTDSASNVFFNCPHWAEGGQLKDQAISLVFDRELRVDVSTDQRTNTVRRNQVGLCLWTPVSRDQNDFFARILVSFRPPWLEFFVDNSGHLAKSDLYRNAWYNHTLPWNINLCEHLDLCSRQVFKLVLNAALDWKEGNVGSTKERQPHRSSTLEDVCIQCKTVIKGWISEKRLVGIHLRLLSIRHLPKLYKPTDERWLAHVSQKDRISTNLGDEWKSATFRTVGRCEASWY